MNGIYFDHEAVQVAEGFISTLTLTKATRTGEPEPFELLPHSRALVANTIGWKRPNGTRLYRKVYFSVGRKQAKTQSAAALACCEFFLGKEDKQEIYMAATDTDQAAICFEALHDMIVEAPDLSSLVEITRSKRLIRHRVTGSIIRVLSSDGKRKHGYNPSMVIFDELHAWGPAHEELFAALTTGSKSRKEPLLVIITTAGSDRESICYREYAYAKRVQTGEVEDPAYLPLIYEIPPDADWTDRSLWPLALPLLRTGHQNIDEYESEFTQAKSRPELQNNFRRLYCNQWTSAETQWIPLHEWDACGTNEFPDLTGAPCFAALDLSHSQDLTALSLCWVVGEQHYTRTHYWLPKGNIVEKSKRDGVPYTDWASKGLLHLCPGDVVDYAVVEADVQRLYREHRVQLLAYDPAFASVMAQNFERARMKIVAFKQSPMNFTEPCLKIERLIYSRRLTHDNHPITRWCFDCAKQHIGPSGLAKLVKPNRLTNSKRIDGAVATTMAIGICHEKPRVSRWETITELPN